MTTQAEPAPQGAVIHAIHRELAHAYEKAYAAHYLLIKERCRDETPAILMIMREEATPRSWGLLTPEERGFARGCLDALDDLYDEKMGAHDDPQR